MWEANVIPQSQEMTLLGRIVRIVWRIKLEHGVRVVREGIVHVVKEVLDHVDVDPDPRDESHESAPDTW